jgi:hypothetical protein
VLGIVGFLFAQPAWAELRVVLVVPEAARDADAQIATRLQAELTAAGFDVRTVPSTAAPSILLLKTLAEREAGTAAVAIVSSPNSVSGIVWMRDERAERVLVRRVPEERRSRDSPSVFAIRATDLLHGGLLQLGYPRPQPPSTVSGEATDGEPASTLPPETPVATAPTPSRETHEADAQLNASRSDRSATGPTWEILAGASSLWGPGGDAEALPWMFSPSVGLEWRPLESWALELRVIAPALGTAGSSTEAANVDQELALLGAGWRGHWGSLVHVAASAGPALYRLGVRGQRRIPLPPNAGRPVGPPPSGRPAPLASSYSDVYWFGCAYGGVGLELDLESRIAVRVLGDLVVLTRRAEIGLTNQQTLQSGVPILVGTLGLALRL